MRYKCQKEIFTIFTLMAIFTLGCSTLIATKEKCNFGTLHADAKKENLPNKTEHYGTARKRNCDIATYKHLSLTT